MRHKDTFATISDTSASTRQFILKKKSLGLLLLILHFMLHSARSNLYSQPEMADDGRCSQLLATITVNAEGIIKSKHTTVANDGRSTSANSKV